ncbi:hypothetical protein ABZZ74_51810 [Streptomyces sp. NPDC006476]|uniref:hypothetical protein n=1 Tax=Streptomyces sp. NPDC006476 TaxID=3157175 RepID=UPI0033B30CD3
MTAPRIPDALTLTAAGLTALGNAPWWVALALVLPSALPAVTQSITEVLAGISRCRTHTMRCRHEDRFLGAITDSHTGLEHIDRIGRTSPPPADPPSGDAALPRPSNDDPTSGPPP